MLQQYIEMLST